jgi:hypothetical protein
VDLLVLPSSSSSDVDLLDLLALPGSEVDADLLVLPPKGRSGVDEEGFLLWNAGNWGLDNMPSYGQDPMHTGVSTQIASGSGVSLSFPLVASETVVSEPSIVSAASAPVVSAPVVSAPVASEPVASEPVASEPVASEVSQDSNAAASEVAQEVQQKRTRKPTTARGEITPLTTKEVSLTLPEWFVLSQTYLEDGLDIDEWSDCVQSWIYMEKALGLSEVGSVSSIIVT